MPSRKDLTDAGVHRRRRGPSAERHRHHRGAARAADAVVSDGPFAETKEQLGGYYLLDCADLDEALAWAKRIPMPGGIVEVRPVMDYEAAGSETHTNEAGVAR